MATFDLNEIFKKTGDIVKAFLARGFFVFGIDKGGLVVLVLRRKMQILGQIPLFLKGVAAANIDVIDNIFVCRLDKAVQHARMIKFLIHDIIDNLGQGNVALHSRAVFDKFVARLCLTLTRKGFCKVEIGLTLC